MAYSCAFRLKPLFQGIKQDEQLKDVVSVQADINIFTVASGLLYEVGFHCIPTRSCISCCVAIRRYYDFICASQYQQHGQILVH